jgi:alcohol dehydrogenase
LIIAFKPHGHFHHPLETTIMSCVIKKCALRTVHYLMKPVGPVLPFPMPRLFSGAGSVNGLPEIIKTSEVSGVMLVTDPGIMAAGLVDPIVTLLRDQAIRVTVFSEVQPNPTIANVEKGLQAYLADDCKGLVAIGGGSALDCGKMIAARAGNPKQSIVKMRGYFKLKKPLPLFIAIPTTAGTGSETTAAAVITDPETHEKFVIASFRLVPSVAFLDPELMIGLPPFITATTGMDALTHAIESYLNLTATPFVSRMAEKAVQLIFQNLEAVYRDGADIEKRNHMAMASYYAGAAFTRGYVGYVHAFAHNMGGLYGIPHGLANAIILPSVLEFNREAAERKLARLAVVAECGRAEESRQARSYRFINKIRTLNVRMGIPTKIKALQKKDIPLIIDRAFKEAHPIYPVPKIMCRDDAEMLLCGLLP